MSLFIKCALPVIAIWLYWYWIAKEEYDSREPLSRVDS